MKLQSKIRQIFSNELLDLIASVCDTKRINSSAEKMKLVQSLLRMYDVKFSILGGATNRLVLFIDGYAVKFAMDNQGYRDNFIEYAICPELQPYVTKAYETNGYILVAECVKTITTKADFITRKQDMLNILMQLSDDYLLGDVGYIEKNITNWGVRDNGELVILDYAYCHRATEKLFTCPVCGEGVLTYDHVFNKLICTNKSVCRATFTYNDRKSEQGDQVDLDMIDERKKLSLVLSEDESFVEVDDNKKGKLVNRAGKKVIVVDNDETYWEMMEDKNMFIKQYDSAEAMDLLVQLALSTADNDTVAKNSVIQDLKDLSCIDEMAEYEMDPDYESERIGRLEDISTIPGPDLSEDEDEESKEYNFDDLVSKALSGSGANTASIQTDFEDDINAPLYGYIDTDMVSGSDNENNQQEIEDVKEKLNEKYGIPKEVEIDTEECSSEEADQEEPADEEQDKIGVILDGKEI